MRFICLAAALGVLGLGGLAAIQPPDESHLPDSEKRIPQGHYCKRPDVPITPRETRAHHCTCKYTCSVDEHGNVSEHEDTQCLAYCHLNGRRCTCHVEEPCLKAGSNALMDMRGHVVAIRRHH